MFYKVLALAKSYVMVTTNVLGFCYRQTFIGLDMFMLESEYLSLPNILSQVSLQNAAHL